MLELRSILWEGTMDRRLDDTKRSIGVQGLQDLEKKALFEKFQQHGGEIIKEKDPPGQVSIRNRQPGALVRKPDAAAHGAQPAAPRRESARPSHSSAAEKSKQAVSSSHVFERLSLWFRSRTGGVMKSGDCLSPGFFGFLHNKAQPRLVKLGLLVLPLAHATSVLRAQVQPELDKLGDYHFEYLLRLDKIYDEPLFRQIDLYDPKKPPEVPLKTIKKPLCEFYKRIYIMHAYSQSALAALTRALEIQHLMENREKSLLARDLQNAKRSINFIFDDLLDKLHLAILNIWKRNFEYGDPELDDLLGITDEDRVGYLTERMVFGSTTETAVSSSQTQSGEAAEDVTGENKNEIEDSNTIYVSDLPAHIQVGFAIMRSINFNEEKLFAGTEAPYSLIGEDSKMYTTEILFEILDREYSSVLAGNKIKAALDYQGGERHDVRKLLSDSYFALDTTRSNIKEFNRIITERSAVERSSSVTPLQKSQTLHKLELERSRLDNMIRSQFGQVLGGLVSGLKMLIDDAREAKHLLQNPDEILHFVQTGGKARRLEGRSIIEAIYETYQFTAALRYRLTEGDLSSIGAKIEQVMNFAYCKSDAPELFEND
ncbi:MAG: hypothetical protein LBC99_01345 [Spirochaetota bacterium]|jgi:hypothetical protein|nr:hypothetical protein [Spirochaetota bacterium]